LRPRGLDEVHHLDAGVLLVGRAPHDLARRCRSASGAVADDRPDDLADFLVYKPEPKTRPWRLLRTEGGYRVLGTPPSEQELERALKAAGARKGATVEVGDEELELA
jgi:hypothetical protein